MYKIYNSKGEVFTQDDAPITGDRARDVQVILQEDESGPYFQTSGDFYVWRDGRWWGVDVYGLIDFLLDTGLVMLGRTITNAEFQAVINQANVDKATWRCWERKP